MNLTLLGFSGTGKTSVSRLLAGKLEKKLVSTEEECEKKARLKVEKFVRKYGWGKFLELESEVIENISDFDDCVVDAEELERIKSIVEPDICISAENKINTEELKELVFKKLEFIRVYCKEVGKKADTNVPLIMRKGNTLRDMCIKLHKDFVSKFRFARIFGKSARFDGMPVRRLDHVLQDKDIVEIRLN